MIERIRREQREKDQAEMIKLHQQYNKVLKKLLILIDTENEIDFIKEEIPKLIEQEILEIQFSLDQED